MCHCAHCRLAADWEGLRGPNETCWWIPELKQGTTARSDFTCRKDDHNYIYYSICVFLPTASLLKSFSPQANTHKQRSPQVVGEGEAAGNGCPKSSVLVCVQIWSKRSFLSNWHIFYPTTTFHVALIATVNAEAFTATVEHHTEVFHALPLPQPAHKTMAGGGEIVNC